MTLGVAAAFNPELPARVTCWVSDATPLPGCTIIFVNTSSQPYCHASDMFPRAVGTGGTWGIWLEPGSYTFSVQGVKGPNYPKVDWVLALPGLDGATFLAGQDWYDPSYIFNVVQTGSVVVAEAGYHVLKLTISGKNAASSDYVVVLTKAWLRQGVD